MGIFDKILGKEEKKEKSQPEAGQPLAEKKEAYLDRRQKKEQAEKATREKKITAHLAKASLSRQRLMVEMKGAQMRTALAMHQERFFKVRLDLEDTKVKVFESGLYLEGQQVTYLLGAGSNV